MLHPEREKHMSFPRVDTMLTQIGDILRNKNDPDEKIGRLLKFQDALAERFSGYQRYNLTMLAAAVGLLAVSLFVPMAVPLITPVLVKTAASLGVFATFYTLLDGNSTGKALDGLLGEQMAQQAEKLPPEKTVSPALLRSMKTPFNRSAQGKYNQYTALLQEYVAATPAPVPAGRPS